MFSNRSNPKIKFSHQRIDTNHITQITNGSANPKASENLNNQINGSQLDSEKQQTPFKSSLWDYKENNLILNKIKMNFQASTKSNLKVKTMNQENESNYVKNEGYINKKITIKDTNTTSRDKGNSETSKPSNLNRNLKLVKKNPSEGNRVNVIRKLSVSKSNNNNDNNIFIQTISRDNNYNNNTYNLINKKIKIINQSNTIDNQTSFATGNQAKSKYSCNDDSKSNANNDSRILTLKSVSYKNNSQNFSTLNNKNNKDNYRNKNANFGSYSSLSNFNTIIYKSNPNIINTNNINKLSKQRSTNSPELKNFHQTGTNLKDFSNLSPVRTTSLNKTPLNRKCLTSDNFFALNQNSLQTKINPHLKNSNTLKDSLAELGPYIKTKLASPPSGLRKCKLGGVLDVKTPKGTESLKSFYLKYKKESQNFEEIYFSKYLKNDSKPEKDLAFFDKKYNFKTLFKVRKNYDYFLENNIRFDQDFVKGKSGDFNGIKKPTQYFSLKSGNFNGNGENNNTLNNKTKSDSRKYKQIINNYKSTKKLTDKKRLDMLYKYDDFFKMRMESIKAKRKVDNLYDYQNEIANLLKDKVRKENLEKLKENLKQIRYMSENREYKVQKKKRDHIFFEHRDL